MARSYGEDISIRDHMLHCAEHAVAQKLDASLIAAALLHDIGWAPELNPAQDPHDTAAAAYLAPLFGPKVSEPVRLHVAAKRYLVTREPTYAALLSPESRRTLARQGGPMDATECAGFEAMPGAPAALALRRLDDAGKEAEPPASRFADYIGLLKTLVLDRAAR